MTRVNPVPFLHVKHLTKVHTRGRFSKEVAFQLLADFTIERPAIVAIFGANGAGKTTLFELIAGTDLPTSGQVICHGQDIHRVKYGQRRLVVAHHRQPHHFRIRKRQFTPDFLLQPARNDTPTIHLYDEPDMTDWYIGLLFNRFRELKSKEHLVIFCVHPSSPSHIELIRTVCDEYVFAQDGGFTRYANFDALLTDPQARDYFGPIINPDGPSL